MCKEINIKAFHGSLVEDINKFRPASHFGCKIQALSAIGAKVFLDESKDGRPTMYEVKINVSEENIFYFERDWGKFGPQGALIPLRTLKLKAVEKEAELEILKRFGGYHGEINNAESDFERLKIAEEFLKYEAGHKYKVIRYPNAVEADGDGYCVIDASVISIDSISTVTWEEVVAAFENHDDWLQVRDAVVKFMNSIGK